MKVCYDASKLSVVLIVISAVITSWSGTQPITGGTFDPPLVPATNKNDTVSKNISHRVIVEDATMTGVEINGVLYTDIEGCTNATMSGTDRYWPVYGTDPGSSAAAVTGLNLAGEFNRSPFYVMFSNTVTRATEGGFFLVEYGGNDPNVNVYPLDSNGDQIGSWVLTIANTGEWGDGHVLYPHGQFLAMGKGSGPVHEYVIGGVAFTLDDFTGGSGILNNVKGLKIVNSGVDLMMAGIYRGPGEPGFFKAGSSVRMADATFDQPLVNPMTNDFSLTGFHRAESITAPTYAYQFDSRTDSSVMWPANGVQPTRTNALLGLDVNGVQNTEYWDFMFAEPVTNSADGFFMIEEAEARDAVLVFPLDADRRPISTYAVATLPNTVQWNNNLLNNNYEVKWSGAADPGDNISLISGVVMPLSTFAGGTGGLSAVYGIRVYSYPLKWDGKDLDLLVVGSYKARQNSLPILDAELDPMPTPTVAANRLSADYRHPWTLTGFKLESGRYTDLEGPANVVLTTPDWEYCVDDPNPPASAVESALGLDSSGLMNANNCKYVFATTVTNGFDGGFFLFVDNALDFKIRPLGMDTNAIANYSIAIDNARELGQILESDMGLPWYRAYGHPPPTGGGYVGRNMRGTAFTLGCFKHETTGEALTNDVIGIQLTDHSSVDPILAGIYRGPANLNPLPAPGACSPITAASFSPAPEGSSSYTNDVDVIGVQSAYSKSESVSGPAGVAVLKHGNQGTYYPLGGINPGSGTAGYTNALSGLNINGFLQSTATEYMFDRPVRQPSDGFFIIEHSGQDLIRARPLDVNGQPISTYSALIDSVMYGHLGTWNMNGTGSSAMRGTMIRKSDFAGGTGELGPIYGIRLVDLGGEFDPAVVGEFFGPLPGTVIFVR